MLGVYVVSVSEVSVWVVARMCGETGGWLPRGILSLRNPESAEPELWSCALMYKHYGEMFRLKVEKQEMSNGIVVSCSIVRPLEYMSSLRVFAAFYEFRASRLLSSLVAGCLGDTPSVRRRGARRCNCAPHAVG